MIFAQNLGDIYKNATCACLMIVRDSEGTIAQCLDSVLAANCFQQIIIVVDTRTVDNTPAILSQYAARYPQIRVIFYEWQSEDYAAARNVALAHARTHYAFWIDADEVLLDGAGVRELLRDPKGKAYHLDQISLLSNGRTIRINQLRLFPIIPGIRWELPVHEQVAFALRALGVQEEMKKYRIWHTGYADDKTVLEHHKKYFGIMTQILSNEPPGARRDYITRQYNNSHRYLQATNQL